MINLILLCISGFIAAFVDSIAGGGGLISLPAYMIFGLSPHIALGTNKFSSTTASFTSSIRFIKEGKADLSLLKYIIPFTFIGAVLGVKSVLIINQSFLTPLVMILILMVGVYSLFSKNLGLESHYKGKTRNLILIGTIFGFSLGFYDGFFGPGTGSFLIFGFIKIFKLDFVEANGNSKILNFTSNIASLITFAIEGKINYTYGILVAFFMILGALIGSKLALKKGAKLIKPIFVTMSLAVSVKMLFSL
ncbi:membrane protein [Clostridium zeae]|uniref:Probable membrane transporter protein n=1 Tax=Clostridium zeae TaxID=2759022 RepID=A0ABQ1E8P9_9CLOT|nr:TSUP family transporter [Clostridium zeae]GFZ31134.1 membrane protein [Clostridium zeae]